MTEPYLESPGPGGPERKGPNWALVVPLGCLGLIVVFGGLGTGCVVMISRLMRSSGAYKLALEKVQADDAVIERLGRPVEPGWFVSGNVSTSGPRGRASLSFPVSGPKGQGTAYVRATKAMGRWKLEALVVEFRDTGKRIEIVASPQAGAGLPVGREGAPGEGPVPAAPAGELDENDSL